NTKEYNDNCLNFWSLIADLESHIDLEDTLDYFKDLFRQSIEEHRHEQEEQHKSSLTLIDDLIEKNQNQQKSLISFNKLKEEILQSLSRYENVSSKSEIRKKLNEIISSNYDLVEKIQKLISKDCLNIYLEFNDTVEEENFYQYLKAKDQNELVYRIFLVIEEILSKPKIKINHNIITIEGYNIIISDLIDDLENKLKELNNKEVRFYGTNIFLDHSLNNDLWRGINLIFASDIINFVKDISSDKKITINVSGKKGQNGKHAEHQQHATRESEDGNDGLPGENGQAGQNGGDIYLIAKQKCDGRLNLEKLITSGGDGGKGGNGGNAGNGYNGKNGQNATEEHYVSFWRYGYHLDKGEEGTRGGNGGTGGDAGLAGLGGHAGLVYIEENQVLITEIFSNLIESNDKSNVSGDDELPGQGGSGGLGG
ncbi:unnamed protein product, partial [Didymodactylos carnosus]